MTHYMGIDGGGSTLRVAIIGDEMTVLAEITRGTANPNLIGREASAQHIQATMRDALETVPDVHAVGIGIAGASAEYASDWLAETVREVLPSAYVAASADNEIALVGALGKREGILVLSGTGSGVFGINSAGEKLQVGGWGYLLGDEGSGYWVGLQAIKTVTKLYDAGESTVFGDTILDILGIRNGRKIVEAVYMAENLVPDIAKLAPVVLELADNGNDNAMQIINGAVAGLFEQVKTAMNRLAMTSPDMAFAGSILTNDNLVSRGLREKLGLDERPRALYPPVIGAALLAKIMATSEA